MRTSDFDRVISIDAETNGLAGRAFAVAMTLSDHTGELDKVVYRCPIDEPVNEWAATNVLPAMEDVEENCLTYEAMLYNLREIRFPWAEDGTPTIGHVVWPVEARLLLDMYPAEDIWLGPYPLLDVASVLQAHGRNPLSVDDYLREEGIPAPEGSPHHPLHDARAAERCLRHLLTGATRPQLNEDRTELEPRCSGAHLWVGRDGRPATGDVYDRCDSCGVQRGHCTCPLNARSCPQHGAASRG